jgi:hypothetical protein
MRLTTHGKFTNTTLRKEKKTMTNHFAKYEDAVKARRRKEDIDLFVTILTFVGGYLLFAVGIFAFVFSNALIAVFVTPWLLFITIPATAVLLSAWIWVLAKVSSRYNLF